MRKLLELEPRLWFSVSATTRQRRAGETDGKDYLFHDRREFERIRDEGGFLEWFDVYDDLYGTPRAPVEEHLAAGDDVLLEVDVQGALAVREKYPDAVLVFVKAPSREEQRRRLRLWCDAYGLVERASLIDDMKERIRETVIRSGQGAEDGARWWDHQLAWVEQNEQALRV